MEPSNDSLESWTADFPVFTSPDVTLGASMKVHSVLDAQLEALALGEGAATGLKVNSDEQTKTSMTLERVDLDAIIENLSAEMVDQNFSGFKSKGPSSVLGTGSSIASASDHSEVSDFESDSGIETSHMESMSPKVCVISSLKKKKGMKLSSAIQPKANPDSFKPIVSTDSDGQLEQTDRDEEQVSCDSRIDSLIRCLDHKVEKEMLTKEALELLRLIPDGYIPLPHQVGGQKHVDGRLGFLRRVGQKDVVYKPVPFPKGPREVMFYKSLFCSYFDDIPKEVIVMKELVPRYYGTHDIVDRDGEIHKFIELEDIVTRFHKPCIMDVKVGRRVWDDYAQQDKIDKEKKKYPLQEIIGFRVTGIRVYNSKLDEYIFYEKEYKRSLSVNGAFEALKKFFMDGEVMNRSDVLGPIIERLNYFLHWMEYQKLFKLFATSVLIVYEGDRNRPIKKPKDLLDIRLVDFAHAYERNPKSFNEPDYNTLFGLQNLVKYLEQLRDKGF